jgi:hypothetical protein
MTVRWLLTLALAAMPLSTASSQTLESALMPGPVIAGHAKLEAECGNCHVRFERAAQDRLCLDCHKPVAADVRAKRGYHGRLDAPGPCRSCHTDHRGREVRIATFDERAFDHARTDFALRGAHAKAACSACHVPGKRYAEASGDCADCHRKDDTHRGALGPRCADCHGEATWKEARFDHARTRFALAGRHAEAACRDCHRDATFRGAPTACIGCHRADDKVHRGRLGERCESCHGVRDWKATTFQHDRDTRYALKGRHRTARCESCHTSPGGREKLPTDCASCHRADDKHQGTLGADCGDCHVERAWKETRIDHDATAFPLRDRHRGVDCQACHRDPRSYKNTPHECVACHRADDTHGSRFGDRCDACHVVRGWREIVFRHDRDTRYALVGRHAAARCEACHSGWLYRDRTATECRACHARDDVHKGSLGERCETCHGSSNWRVAAFDHARTRFPLAGRHARIDCKSCHRTSVYREAPRDCVGCHEPDDKHRGRLGNDCESCHNARDWRLGAFDHRRTRFALDGAHASVACVACHVAPGARIAPLGVACADCHRADDVHHGAYGPQCERCHVTSTFREIRKPGAAVQPGRSP